MVLVTTNRRYWYVGLAVSLLTFAIVYFTVIRPSTDTANQAIRTGLQQSQQLINQEQQQLSHDNTAAGAPGAANGAISQAHQQLSNASKLTSCLAAAGTNFSAVQACQTRFGS
jgi:hypothetical protein